MRANAKIQPVSILAVRRATYADVLAAADHVVAEVVNGVLHTHPRPAPRHAVAASALGADLHGAFHRGRGGPGGWVILGEPELHLGVEPDILVPDIAGWRRERMNDVPRDVAYFTTTPDWVCEILSPSTQALDRSEKMDVYAREGVAHVWLVDPLVETLEVYRLRETRWERIGAWRGDVAVSVEPFAEVAIELSALWKL